jgi:tRNA G18 (ribose-2'-O)-methylase SpoU
MTPTNSPSRGGEPQKTFYVIVHNIRSLFNVGSLFRTADAFSVSKIFLTGYTPTPAEFKHKVKISKTALGAEETVPWEHKAAPARLIKELRLKHPKIQIIALENNIKSKTVMLNNFKPKFPLVLILGEEVGGVDKSLLKLCDKIIEIPMLGQKESLNVSVAFGIAAYTISNE